MTRLLAASLISFCVATAVRAENPLDAHWIWFDEGEPGVEAPAGKVWFRYEARASEPSTAVVRVAADDGFVLWANGRRVGEGEGGRVYRYHLNGIVERGVNVIAVEAYNRGGPAGLLVAHFFNHQTHHRGQVHAMLTQAGAKPDDTDLMLLKM